MHLKEEIANNPAPYEDEKSALSRRQGIVSINDENNSKNYTNYTSALTYSPDLVPCNFYLFADLETIVIYFSYVRIS